MPAISQVAHSKSIWNTRSSGTYQPIMSNPIISTLVSKWHVIWWVCPILWYSQPLPSDRSTCFLQLSWRSALPIFFVLTSEDLATLGRPCGQVSQMDPWQRRSTFPVHFFPFLLSPIVYMRLSGVDDNKTPVIQVSYRRKWLRMTILFLQILRMQIKAPHAP